MCVGDDVGVRESTYLVSCSSTRSQRSKSSEISQSDRLHLGRASESLLSFLTLWLDFLDIAPPSFRSNALTGDDATAKGDGCTKDIGGIRKQVVGCQVVISFCISSVKSCSALSDSGCINRMCLRTYLLMGSRVFKGCVQLTLVFDSFVSLKCTI